MRNCIKITTHTLLAAAITLVGLSMFSCTSVDDTLGKDLLPKDQEMTFHSSTVNGIGTYMIKSDSIPVSNLGYFLLGSYKTDHYGTISSEIVAQYVPSYFSYDYFYGYKPTVDSVMISLYVKDVYGDADDVEQKFYIYELSESITRDSTYYPSFDAEAVANMATPIFSFKIAGKKIGQNLLKLNYESGGQDFIDRLVGVEEYDTDTAFRAKFKGLYIARSTNAAEAPDDALLYNMSPLSVHPYDYTFLGVYAHSLNRPEEEDPLERKDTILVRYSFDDKLGATLYPSTSINLIRHDYTGSLVDETTFLNAADFDVSFLSTDDVKARVEKLDAKLALLPPSMPMVYTQGLLGVSSYLHFTDEFVEELKSKAMFNGEEWVMMINRAMMYVWIEDDGVEYLKKAPRRLGMYYNMKGVRPVNIQDYMYYEEQTYQTSIAYKGFLVRGSGLYEMDISMYIRSLVNKTDETLKGVWLAPGMTTDVFFKPWQVALQNDPALTPEKRVRIDVSYTLLKKR